VHPVQLMQALYLAGQSKLFHIYPVNRFNSKKEFLENAARDLSFNRTKMPILRSFQICPSNFH
jgi:hypothetical protein